MREERRVFKSDTTSEIEQDDRGNSRDDLSR